jgi:hypothetical protein
MSKKSFDHIENKIREAAANSEPDFDEFAWSKMETLLDKEKGNKRRYIFWWFLLPLLFLGTGSAYLFFKHKPNEKIAVNNKGQNFPETKSAQIKTTEILSAKDAEKTTIAVKKIMPEKTIHSETEYAESQAAGNSRDIKPANGIGKKIIPVKIIHSEAEYAESQTKAGNNKNHKDGNISTLFLKEKDTKIKFSKKGKLSFVLKAPAAELIKDTTVYEDNGNDISVTGPLNINDTPGKKNNLSVNDSLVKKQPLKDTSQILASNKNTDKKTKVKSPHSFYLLAAAGADAGSVKLLSLKNSTVTARYGVGIGYQFSKRLSLQTGFYAGRKKYIAGPGDYKAKQGSYWSTVQIVKVGASCLIYDIPITIRYNFLQKPATIFYTTAGISSFIMKKEDYNYHYFRNYIYNQSSWSYTGNKNLFAVFNFSAGIEKKLSHNFSIQAEPSISIPLSGVGDGRVKLYSTALQVAIKYQLSKKNK